MVHVKFVPYGEIYEAYCEATQETELYWEYIQAGVVEYVGKTGEIYETPYFKLARVIPKIIYNPIWEILTYDKENWKCS